MQKNICYLILLFISSQALAVEFEGSNYYKILKLKNKQDSTEIYIPDYKNKYFQLYKSNYIYQQNDSIAIGPISSDVISVGFPCGNQEKDLDYCFRYFNRRTSQMSTIFHDAIDANTKQNVVAYQVLSKDLIVVTPMFQNCSNPLTYKIKIYPDTDFGVKTKFLQNGDLQLDYVDLNNKLVLKKIPIDYKKLYQRCGVKESVTFDL